MFFFNKDAAKNPISETTVRQVLAHSGDLMVCQLTGKANDGVAEHTHPHTQITYVISGRVSVTIGGETRELGPGDSALMPPNVPHSAINLEDTVSLDIFNPAREDFLKQ